LVILDDQHAGRGDPEHTGVGEILVTLPAVCSPVELGRFVDELSLQVVHEDLHRLRFTLVFARRTWATAMRLPSGLSAPVGVCAGIFSTSTRRWPVTRS